MEEYKGDKYYLEKVLNGNSNAYAFIVDRYRDNVFSLAHKISGSFEDAEEIAQDSFIKAYRSLQGFRNSSKFSTWLYRITYNTSVSCIRKKNRSIMQIEDFPADAVDFLRESDNEETAELEYRRALLSFAIQKLGPDDRALISMYYFQEMNADEICEVTGISRSNLKVRLFRSRKKIEEIIVKHQEKERMSYERV